MFEMTVKVQVGNIEEGVKWYSAVLNKAPDRIPHPGSAEWQPFKGCWLQMAEGKEEIQGLLIRIGVHDIQAERDRLRSALQDERIQVSTKQWVPVKWIDLKDPWGNTIGFYEYLDKEYEKL